MVFHQAHDPQSSFSLGRSLIDRRPSNQHLARVSSHHTHFCINKGSLLKVDILHRQESIAPVLEFGISTSGITRMTHVTGEGKATIGGPSKADFGGAGGHLASPECGFGTNILLGGMTVIDYDALATARAFPACMIYLDGGFERGREKAPQGAARSRSKLSFPCRIGCKEPRERRGGFLHDRKSTPI
jgi:hypothetical protein